MAEATHDENSELPHTVAAVFEDTIDGALALRAIRKANRDADTVSLVVLVGDELAHDMDVARAVAKADLDDVGGWLQGFATINVPRRGTFLVAGPLGAVVAGMSAEPAGGSGEGSFQGVMQEFGFSVDEAHYLDRRLAAGAPLVAATTRTGESPAVVRRLLADQSAVFIGTVETAPPTLEAALDLLEARPEASIGGHLHVADAVGNLRRVGTGDGPAPISALFGQFAVDRDGNEVGQVEDALVEVYDPDGRSGPLPEEQVVRYLVIGFGGVLGIRRHRVAVPVLLVDLQARPVRLEVERDTVHRAPALTDEPFSRHDEQAVNDHFGVRAYWLDQAASA